MSRKNIADRMFCNICQTYFGRKNNIENEKSKLHNNKKMSLAKSKNR